MNVRTLFDIEGRRVLITGARGLYGSHITEAFLESGCRVAVASRNLAALEKFAGAVSGTSGTSGGGSILGCFELDQGDPSSIESCVGAVTAKLGGIDILVNNAVLRPMKHFDDDIARFDESMRVNATGLFHLTRLVAAPMCERRSGSIINVASIQGVVGVDPTLYEGTPMDGAIPDYFFHKGGMINLTRMLASRYGKSGVRVNAVSPGGLYNDHNPIFLGRYEARTQLGRMAGPDDIKGVMVFLASDASAYITGENIMVDGGYVQK
jgi:NAD(P)-dependent dehydrogenase (short-subunit alcohol dehydrogenase family)